MSKNSQNCVNFYSVEDETCLICWSSLESSEPSDRFASSEPKLLSEQLQNYFVLRHILDIPEYQLSYYLSLNLGSKQWIKLCHNCSVSYLQKCLTLYGEVKKAERTFNRLKTEIKRTVKDSSLQHHQSGSGRVSSKWSITDETRRFVCNRTDDDLSLHSSCQEPFSLDEELADDSQTLGDYSVVNIQSDFEVKTEPEESHIQNVHFEIRNNGDDGDHFLNKAKCMGDIDEFKVDCNGGRNVQDEDHTMSLGDDSFLDETESHGDDPDFPAPVPKSKGKGKRSARKPPKRSKTFKPIKVKKRPKSPSDKNPTAKNLVCRRCSRKFTTAEELEQHRRNEVCLLEKPNPVFLCPHCRKQFSYEGNLRVHVISCPAAPQQPSSRGNAEASIADSISTSIPGEPTCPKCNFTFRYRCKLVEHLRKGNCSTNSKPAHVCSNCGRSYHRISGLKKHKCDTMHVCDQCPFKSTRAYVVDFHKISKHGQKASVSLPEEEAQADNTCPKCGRVFSTKTPFIVHQARCKAREGEGRKGVRAKASKNWMCDQCDKRFVSPGRLQQHIEAHHLNKIHLCPECGFQTKCIKSFNCHVRSMHGPYSDPEKLTCYICNKIFSTPGNAKLHMEKTHKLDFQSKVIVVSCQLCGKQLTAKQSLAKHMAAVHGVVEEGQGHFCKHCGRGFAFRYSLNKHENKCRSWEGRMERKTLGGEEKTANGEQVPIESSESEVIQGDRGDTSCKESFEDEIMDISLANTELNESTNI